MSQVASFQPVNPLLRRCDPNLLTGGFYLKFIIHIVAAEGSMSFCYNCKTFLPIGFGRTCLTNSGAQHPVHSTWQSAVQHKTAGNDPIVLKA